MKIVVSGGGSGGHVTPILAVAHHLTARGNQLYYIGSGSAGESRLFGGSGITMCRIPAGKYRRYTGQGWSGLLDLKTLVLNIRDLGRFSAGFIKSIWLLLRIRPDRVFIKGGYVGLPVGLAAWVLRIPFIIHESDRVPGLTNRVLKRFTPYRVSGFETDGFRPLGNPVREDILRPVQTDRARFGITSQKPVVVVFGGSQGSRDINAVTRELTQRYDEFEIIHLHGQEVPAPMDEYEHYHPYEFLTGDMPHALQVADAVVARAGANTLAELAVLAKPAIVIPHPSVSGDHQTQNALAWRDSICLLPQSELTLDKLVEELRRIVYNPSMKRELSEAISARANPAAAADIADYVLTPHEAD